MKTTTLVFATSLIITQAVSISDHRELAQTQGDPWEEDDDWGSKKKGKKKSCDDDCNLNIHVTSDCCKKKKDKCPCVSFVELACPDKWLWRDAVWNGFPWGPDNINMASDDHATILGNCNGGNCLA